MFSTWRTSFVGNEEISLTATHGDGVCAFATIARTRRAWEPPRDQPHPEPPTGEEIVAYRCLGRNRIAGPLVSLPRATLISRHLSQAGLSNRCLDEVLVRLRRTQGTSTT